MYVILVMVYSFSRESRTFVIFLCFERLFKLQWVSGKKNLMKNNKKVPQNYVKSEVIFDQKIIISRCKHLRVILGFEPRFFNLISGFPFVSFKY